MKIHFIPNPDMAYERRSNYLGKIRQEVSQFAREVYLVGRQWVRLAWYFGCCVLMTSRLVLRMILWIVRVLMPIPGTVGPTIRQRRTPTGLAIPAIDLMVLVFGTATLIGYIW